MKRTEIAALYGSPETFGDTQVTVCGWARSIRDSKALGFIDLNDGSCFKGVQIVFTAEKLENYKEIASQNVGAALRVTGTLLLTPEAKQPFEIQAEEITVEGASSPEYPLQKKRHTVEYLRTVAHLRPRTNLFNAAFRVRSAAAFAIHKFFNENGFTYVHTPIVTGSDCEGAGEMFQLTTLDLVNVPKNEDGTVDYSKDFFGKQTSLTVSGQLEAECMAMAFGKVYTFGPTFRAERSYTQRHAAEFWMVEPEIAFADLNDDMDLMEAMIKYIIKDVMARCPQDIDFFNQFVDKGLKERLEHVANSDFVRISYTDAVKLLEKNNDNFEYKVSWGCDLQTEHERYLTEKEFGKPVFVAVNKMDNPARMDEVWEFYALGLGDPWPVSAQHGNGTGDLLDEVVNELRKVEVVPEEEVEAINVAIIGRPNAGKSSLTNKLTNNNRSIVSDVAGTTRDAIDTLVEHEGQMYRIVDTAGLRRKSQIDQDVEYYGFVRAMRAIDRADVALLVIDGTLGLTNEDQRVAGYAA